MVVDVGANTGQYGRQVRAAGYTGLIISFEPLPEAFAKLQNSARSDPAWECRRMALGDIDSEIPLQVSADSVSSSILPTLEQLVDAEPTAAQVGSLKVPIRRLDSALG